MSMTQHKFEPTTSGTGVAVWTCQNHECAHQFLAAKITIKVLSMHYRPGVDKVTTCTWGFLTIFNRLEHTHQLLLARILCHVSASFCPVTATPGSAWKQTKQPNKGINWLQSHNPGKKTFCQQLIKCSLETAVFRSKEFRLSGHMTWNKRKKMMLYRSPDLMQVREDILLLKHVVLNVNCWPF